MVHIIATTSLELAPSCEKLLSNLVIFTLDRVYSHLLHVSHVSTIIGPSTIESFFLVSNVQNNIRSKLGGDWEGNQGNYPKCNYCHRWGHTREECFKLHDHPPCANIAHTHDS